MGLVKHRFDMAMLGCRPYGHQMDIRLIPCQTHVQVLSKLQIHVFKFKYFYVKITIGDCLCNNLKQGKHFDFNIVNKNFKIS